MDNEFLRSLCYHPCTVLNRKLKPFSAWHAAGLMLLDSPFVNATGEPIAVERKDLILAAYVCGTEYPSGAAALYPEPDLVAVCEWGESVGAWDFEEELAKFDQQYLAHYLTLPQTWQSKKGETKISAIPWPFYVVGIVLQFMKGIEETAAWNLPISRLVSYKTSIAERHGVEVQSQRQKELRELARKIAADAVLKSQQKEERRLKREQRKKTMKKNPRKKKT